MGIFKAYDIRGIYPEEINEETGAKIGSAFAQFLGSKEIVVGRDMRNSSPNLAREAIKGIVAAGGRVFDIGMVSTPMVYFAVGHYGYGGGMMTTASHNPAQYNGFKLCRENAIPISGDTGLEDIEATVEGAKTLPTDGKGEVVEKDILPDYKKHLLSFVRGIGALKIVVDSGNGIVGTFLPEIMDDLPCEIIPLFFEPDGNFPNHEANPLKDENIRDLKAKVLETGANLGVAFDGDGDRCMFVDENGERVSSDIITALIAQNLLKRDKGAKIVYDLRSSWALPKGIEKGGGVPIRERVGHSFIKATMRRENALFGGELSGHYYYRDNFYADSGMITMIEVLNIVSSAKTKLSDLANPFKNFFATGELNFEVEDKDGKMKELAQVFADGKIDYLDGVSVEYSDWWFNVRKSNTEPLLRLNLEAKTKEGMVEAKNRVMKVLGEAE